MKGILPIGIAIVVGLVLAVAGMSAFLLTQSSGQTEGASVRNENSPIDYPGERSRWSSRIAEVGPGNAYQEFTEAYKGETFDVQHLAAHVMGEVLYEALGLDGMPYCDSSFAFGCYHSFFGVALADHGEDAIPELDRSCVDQFGPLGTGCQHGIGHGILIYSGRSEEALVRALESCKKTTQLKELFGCTSGVFMEYNLPTVFDTESAERDVRSFDEEHPYAPCDAVVPDQFKKSCYYELSQWWQVHLGQNYAELGELCAGVEAGAWRENCFLGLGNVAAPSNRYDVERTIAACEEMPSREAELLCRAGASWSFFAAPEGRDRSPELCEGVGPAEEEKCIQKSDLIGNGEKFQ